MFRSRFVRLLAVCISIIAVVFAGVSFAQDAEPLVILAAEEGITLPEGLVSGITTITLQNDSEIDFAPTIARFIDGATMEDFMAAMQAQDFAGMLATVSALGSTAVKPGESADVTFDLTEGDYLLLNFGPGGPPTILPFTVAENEGEMVEAPEADVEIVMTDFAFGLPVEQVTGDAVWHFSNVGEQLHEIVIFSVDADATVEGVTAAVTAAMMAATPGTQPEMPYEEAFAFIGLSPEENAWMTVNLEPGTYAALCFIPDTTTTPPTSHLMHGMITLFTVGE
jgi:hypothetical protein